MEGDRVMRYLSVCSGIEAASAAWMPLGWRPVAFSEIEPFPTSVLAHHHPGVPNWGDMTKYKEWPDEPIDLLCGGTPCQSFSVAGLRKGLADPRGNLMLTFGAIAARYRPRWLVWENVPGVLSSNGGRDFGTFLGMLGQLGYGFAYRVLDAQYVRVESHPRAVPQRRRRVFVVGHSGGQWHRAAAVLFERASLCGHPAPSREARQVAPTIPARSTAGGGLGTDFDCDGGLQVAGTMKACKDSGGWSNSADHAAAGYMVPVRTLCVATGQAGAEIGADTAPTLNCNHEAPYVAHSLRGEGFDASEDGTGRGTPLVPHVVGALACNTGPNGHDAGNFACNQAVDAGHVLPMFLHANKGRPAGRQSAHTEMVSVKDIVETLTTDGHAQSAVAVPVAYGIRTANTSSNGWGIQEECTHTLDCAQGVAVAQPVADANSPPPALFYPVRYGYHQQDTLHHEAGIMSTLPSGSNNNVGHYTATVQAMQVRRLTPEECEALQGFPRSHTAIPWRGKPADQCPDGPRYKALGNSWAVNCARWIGERIEAVEAA